MRQRMLTFIVVLVMVAFTACGSDNTSSEAEKASPNTLNSSVNETQAPLDSDSGTEENQTENDLTETRTLIAYFSLVDIVPEGADASTHATPEIGNTQSAAIEIQRQVGGDLFAIQTVQSYPVLHREDSVIAEEEMRSDARPELSTHIENMDDYDIIFLGYPIWWYIEPMAIRSFLEEYDFSGKTIIPFCTTLGAGIAESEDNISNLTEGATVLEGLTLRTGRKDMSEEIAAWLKDIEMTD